MIKKLLLIMIIFLFIPIVMGTDIIECGQLIFNDSFDYTGTYDSQGWTYSGACDGFGYDKPVYFTDKATFSFGWNGSIYCPLSSSGHLIGRTIPRITNNTFLLKYNYSIRNDNISSQPPMTVLIYDSAQSSDYIRIENRDAGWHVLTVAGVGSCALTLPAVIPQDIEFSLVWELDNNIVGLYANDIDYGCSNLEASGIDSVNNIKFSYAQYGAHDLQVYVDDVTICNGTGTFTPEEQECLYPKIFCSDFDDNNYIAMMDYPWNAVKLDGSINLTYRAKNSMLKIDDAIFYSPRHMIDKFPVNYTPSSHIRIVESERSPVFTVEFDVTPIINNFTYEVDDKSYAHAVYRIVGTPNIGNTMNLSLLQPDGSLLNVCDGCLIYNASNFIKISAYFIDQTDGEYWNASFTDNHINFYIKNAYGAEYVMADYGFYDNSSVNQKLHIFIKEPVDIFYIDNYYIYVGTNKIQSDISNYYDDYYMPSEWDGYTGSWDDESEDLADKIQSSYGWMGLHSSRSKFFFALAMIIIIDIMLLSSMMATNIHLSGTAIVGVLGIIDFLGMILCVYIGLLPVWVPTVFMLIGIGAGVLAMKLTAA